MLKQLRRFFEGDEWLPAKRQVTGKEGEWWKKLHRGSKLTFDRMAQPELSSQELLIGDTCRYDFGSAHFVAYIMEKQDAQGNSTPIAQIIVADGRREECYLAISRKLDEEQQRHLLDEAVLQDIAKSNTPARIHVRASGVVAYAPWAVESYRKQINGIRGKKTLQGRERFFEYSLFVSANNERAIEVEQYEDGTRELYLTLYRPASDIVSIFHATRFEAEKTQPALVKHEPEVVAARAREVTLTTQSPAVGAAIESKEKVEPEKLTGSGLADIRAQIQMNVEQERARLRTMPSVVMPTTTTTAALSEPSVSTPPVITLAQTPAVSSTEEVSGDTTTVDVSSTELSAAMQAVRDAVLEDEETDIAVTDDVAATTQELHQVLASVRDDLEQIATHKQAADEVAVSAPEPDDADFAELIAAIIAEQENADDTDTQDGEDDADVLRTMHAIEAIAREQKAQDEAAAVVASNALDAEEDSERQQELMRTLQEVATAVDLAQGDDDVVIAGSVTELPESNPVQIDCHIRVAARLIDEALRRDMRLEDVVRKALGMPIAPAEKVSFTLNLNEKEYQDLAERFGCSPYDKQAIHAAIVEDLIDFSGERARLDALKPSLKTANS